MQKREFTQLSIEHLWGLVVLCGVFIFVNTHPIRPNDFWFHLAYGRLLSQGGQIPLVDVFSFTMEGQPYTSAYNYWLAQWIMYQLFVCVGTEGMILVFSLLVTLAYGLVLWLCLRISGDWRLAAAGALFAAVAGITNWNARPQLLVYPLAALSIASLEAIQNRRRLLWLWYVLLFGAMTVWVNCHATFFIPFLLTGFWLVELLTQAVVQRKPRLTLPALVVLIILLAGAMVNPRGYRVFLYVYEVPAASLVQDYLYEWQAASFQTLEGVLFFSLCTILLVAWVVGHYRPTLSQTLSFVFFTLLALKYVRAVVWFGLTQSLFFVLLLQAAKDRFLEWRGCKTTNQGKHRVEHPSLNIMLAALIVALSLTSLPWLRGYWPLSPEKQDIYAGETPVGATTYLLEHRMPERVFSDIGFSSYLIWACGPRCRVFVDPRFNLYPLALWQDYIRISAAVGDWQNRLEVYGVDTLILSPKTQDRLINAARQSRAWKQVYEDAVAVVFVRRE